MPGLNDDVCRTVLGQRALGSVARERRYIPPMGGHSTYLAYREHLVGSFGPLHDPPQRHMKQFPSGLLVAALLVASGLMWAVMFFGPLAHLSRLAGGATPFDIRPKGYRYDEARAFLDAIGEQGRECYANPELVLDMFYPPLYAVSRGLALGWLTMPGRVREASLPLSWRAALIAVPVIMASLDVVENGCIAAMLWTWPDLSLGLVRVSSLATRMKIMTGVQTEILMAGLAVIWLVRRSRRRLT